MIHIENLSVHYGKIPAIEDLSLSVAKGECLLVTGPSGCGKSTLGRVLSGLIPHAIPASITGNVQVAGIDLLDSSIPAIAQHVGAVFQNPASQLFHLRVEDEVAFGPRNLGLSPEQIYDRVNWALAATGLSNLRHAQPIHLSGGQKQRLAIAGALAMCPQVLVLDEPTASLDVPGTNTVIATLRNLRQQYGITIILIEHRLAEAASLADRVTIMNQGKIFADGDTNQVLADREMLRSLGLRRPTDDPPEKWETLLTPNGHPPSDLHPLIEMRQLAAGYNRHPVLQDINLTLYPGELAALVGDNGAGKSTLALTAAGLLKPLTGEINFHRRKRPRPGLDVSLLFQNPIDQLFTNSVEEEIAFGPHNYGTFTSEAHEKILLEADLQSLRSRRPTALSAGQQQRTAFAASLSLFPHLVILDEPTLGQDWGHLERLMDYLTHLNQQGLTILLITHDYKLVHRYARRVILLENGRITMDGQLNTNKGNTP